MKIAVLQRGMNVMRGEIIVWTQITLCFLERSHGLETCGNLLFQCVIHGDEVVGICEFGEGERCSMIVETFFWILRCKEEEIKTDFLRHCRNLVRVAVV